MCTADYDAIYAALAAEDAADAAYWAAEYAAFAKEEENENKR